MTTDHTPTEAGTDPRVDILAEQEQGRRLWESLDEGARESMRPHYRDLLARLDAARPSVVPGDTATEGGDVRERAVQTLVSKVFWFDGIRGEHAARSAAAALAAAGLLATAGTEGEAEGESTAVRIARMGLSGHVKVARAASPQNEAQGQGEDEPALAERVRSLVATWRALNDDLIEKSQARYRRSSGPSDAVAGRLQDRAQEVRRSARELEALLGEPAAAPRAVAPGDTVDRYTLVERLRAVIEWVSARDHARAIELDEVVHELETLAALRGENQ